jgi:peptidoglycan/xylan/chitin deacetylase (PgdA/CDA1 family)
MAASLPRLSAAADPPQAMICISLDLEMARHYPTWEQTYWDYEKGNLDEDTKKYAVRAAETVRGSGGVIHFFAVGRVFEQENIDWLKQIVAAEHPVGNHTYDHVNIRARKLESLQLRFRRAPWLIHAETPQEAIADNVRMTTLALKERLGIEPAGFRAPGGFPNGLADYPEIQAILQQQGFDWVSTKYVQHSVGNSGYDPQYQELRKDEPPAEVYDEIVRAQAPSQPNIYPSGLVEIPMCPVSDLIAFRTGRWRLEHFLKAIRQVVTQAIEKRYVFVFLGHPSCLSVTDPGCETFKLITRLVNESRGKAQVVGLDAIARRVRQSQA